MKENKMISRALGRLVRAIVNVGFTLFLVVSLLRKVGIWKSESQITLLEGLALGVMFLISNIFFE